MEGENYEGYENSPRFDGTDDGITGFGQAQTSIASRLNPIGNADIQVKQ